MFESHLFSAFLPTVCLCPLSTFLLGWALNELPFVRQHSLVRSFQRGVYLYHSAETALASHSHFQMGRDPSETLLSSFSLAPSSSVQHSGRGPASAGRPPHLAPLSSSSPCFRTGHFSVSLARSPPLSSSSAQLLWWRFPRGQTVDTAYLVHTPKVNTLAGVSVHICSIHAVAPATETKPGKNKKLS